MNERDIDVQGAMDWVADFHANLENRFNEVYKTLQRWGGAVDMDVQEYALVSATGCARMTSGVSRARDISGNEGLRF